MTAMRDAMKRAGMNTAAAELYAKTTEFLRKPETADKRLDDLIMVRPELRAVLRAEYLARVRADMKGETYQPPQPPSPSPSSSATAQAETPAASAPSPKTAAKAESITHVGAYDRRAQNITRKATVSAWSSGADAIFGMQIGGRAIGDMSFAELGKLRSESAFDAANSLRYGTERAMHAFLLNKIAGHARVPDQTIKISQVITAEKLEEYVEESRVEALRFVETRVRTYAHELETGNRQEIADAG